MKTVRLVLQHDAETIHPMHRYVAESDAFDSYRMVHGNFTGEGENVLLFHVVGDADAYERALADADGIESYEITRNDERSFSVYVRDVPAETGERLLESFTQGSLVALPPLEYRSDWTVRFSVVGEPADLQQALETIPDGIDGRVQWVGDYERADAGAATLTQRQREALETARDIGYFEVPREASLAEIADELGVTPGTASEHLQKAESKIIDGLDL